MSTRGMITQGSGGSKHWQTYQWTKKKIQKQPPKHASIIQGSTSDHWEKLD